MGNAERLRRTAHPLAKQNRNDHHGGNDAGQAAYLSPVEVHAKLLTLGVFGGQALNMSNVGDRRHSRHHIIELLFGYFVVTLVIGLVGYLVIVNPALNPTNADFFNTVLALAVGIAATFLLGGYLHLQGTVAGLSMRCGGGLAAFALVFLGAPQFVPSLVPGPSEITLGDLKAVDFRSILPRSDDDSWPSSDAVISVEFPTYDHTREETRIGRLLSEKIRLTLDNEAYELDWLYFVDIAGITDSGWLGVLGTAKAKTIPAGEVVSHTTMFRAERGKLEWQYLVQKMLNAKSGIVELFSTLGGTEDDPSKHSVKSVICNLNVKLTQEQIKVWQLKSGTTIPAYFQINCI